MDREVVNREWKDWREGGFRQTASSENVKSVQIADGTGVNGKAMHETCIGSNGGKTGEFDGQVTQTWVSAKYPWKLLAVTIHCVEPVTAPGR
jgi:hypothetical protein